VPSMAIETTYFSIPICIDLRFSPQITLWQTFMASPFYKQRRSPVLFPDGRVDLKLEPITKDRQSVFSRLCEEHGFKRSGLKACDLARRI
jgi:hypothetical protein